MVGPAAAAERAPPVVEARREVVPGPEAGPVLVLGAPGPGQVDYAAFLAEWGARIRAAVGEELAAAGRSADDCPVLAHWLEWFGRAAPATAERFLRRWLGPGTPEGWGERAVAHAREGARQWVLDGSLRLPTTPAEGPPAGAGEGPPGPPEPMVQGDAGQGEGVDARAARRRLGAGRPLPSGVRGRMEAGLGRRLDGVRVHDDARGAELAAGLGAAAVTVGQDVAFAAGRFRPGSWAGDLLIAHELAHTVQQSAGGPAGSRAPLEAEADAAAVRTVVGGRAAPLSATPLRLQACSDVDVDALLADHEGTPEGLAAAGVIRILEGQEEVDDPEQAILALLSALEPAVYRAAIEAIGAAGYLDDLYGYLDGDALLAWLALHNAKLIAARAGAPEAIEGTLAELMEGRGTEGPLEAITRPSELLEGVNEITGWQRSTAETQPAMPYAPQRLTRPSTWLHPPVYPDDETFLADGTVRVLWRVDSGLHAPMEVIIPPGAFVLVSNRITGERRPFTGPEVVALAEEYDWDQFLTAVTVVSVALGGLAVAGARTALAALGAFVIEVLVPSVGQYVADHREEILGMDGGPEFMRAWTVLNLAIGAYGITRLATGGGRYLLERVRDTGRRLRTAHPESTVAQQLGGHLDELDAQLAQADQALPAGGAAADAPMSTVPDAPMSTVPDAPMSTVPDAPMSTVPDAPMSTAPDAPMSTVPDAPMSTVPDAPMSTAPEPVTTAPEPVTTAPPASTAPAAAARSSSRWARILAADGRPTPPSHLANPHAHHIVMKGEFAGWGADARRYVTEAQALLGRYGIDVFTDPANLTWAENAGHSVAYARRVHEELYDLVGPLEEAGLDAVDIAAAIRDRLRYLGEAITDGTFP